MKSCGKCGIRKSLEAFHKDKRGSNGRSSRCKDCQHLHYKAKHAAIVQKRKREKYTKGRKATQAVQTALRNGSLKKEPCWLCGKEKVEGHHLLYDFPLKVIWLCSRHHNLSHREKSYEETV